MAYEIDYIPVGDGERSGDAIALRFGGFLGLPGGQIVMVIDGGFKDSGELLVNHIRDCYKTDYVDLVISTHPDADHASGLSVVLEQLRVGGLLMHKPWNHAAEIKGLFKDGRITHSGLEAKMEKSLQNASDLETMANRKGVPIIEPFQGVTGFGDALHILGPSREYYESLLPLFRGIPEPLKALQDLLGTAKRAVEGAMRWVEDHLHIDLLNDDDDGTSAENNTSTIILFSLDGDKLLFTGDAGKTALLAAADYAESRGISLAGLQFLDVPHHGSKRNLSSRVLNRINATTAFISAPKTSPKHPAKKVTNALQKYGANVYVTRGSNLLYSKPAVRGWISAQAEQFHLHIEE